MGFDPINPVALIGGAGAGVGAACALEMAPRADGGLILTDYDEDALAATADSLARAPERVSMLALDPADPQRWRDAAEFIAGQFGRLDWAVLDAGAAFPRRHTYLDAAAMGVEALMPLIGDNRDGGAIVLMTSAQALLEASGASLLDLLSAAAQRGAALQVRVSALAFGHESESWDAPLFQDLLRDHGGGAGAFAYLADLDSPIARLPGVDLGKLMPLMLAEGDGGAVLAVDGAHTL
jgi:NAD(P)-dependent dehydrogenase (short-subunit alcohol dehydrogenase family)